MENAFFYNYYIFFQASLNLLGCLDTLSQIPDSNLMSNEEESTKSITQKSHTKEDYSAVNRLRFSLASFEFGQTNIQ